LAQFLNLFVFVMLLCVSKDFNYKHISVKFTSTANYISVEFSWVFNCILNCQMDQYHPVLS